MIKQILAMLAPEMRLMFDKGSSAPPAPDPYVVSGAQTASNLETARANARLNRVNQFTPYGNLTYTQSQTPTFNQSGYDEAMRNWQQAQQQGTRGAPVYGSQEESGVVMGYGPNTQGSSTPMPTRDQFMTPGSDEWTANITLSPEQQALLNQDNRIKTALGTAAEQGLGRVNAAMGQPFDTSGMTAYGAIPQGGGTSLGGGAQAYNPQAQNYTRDIAGGNIQTRLPNSDYAAQRTAVEDAIYSRLNPQIERDRQAQQTRLANQGLAIGSEGYREEMDALARQANDARMQAILAGGQEQSRLAGLDLAAGNFANQAQQQGFGQNATRAALNNSVNDTMFNQGLQTTNQGNQAQQQNWAQQFAGNQQNFAQQIAASNAANQQRQQQLQEQSYLRGLPLNELNALRTGSQVTNPQFTPTPQATVAGTDVSGNIWNSYNANVANANAEQAGNNSFLGGLFGIGTAALGSPWLGGLMGLGKK